MRTRAGSVAALVTLLLAACGTAPGAKSAQKSPEIAGAVVSPSPIPSESPLPSPSESPSPEETPSPSGSPAEAATPNVTGAALNGDHAVLGAPPAGFGPKHSAGDCHAWVDTGWTGDCGLVVVYDTTPAGSLGWVIEHKGSGAAADWRVFIMTYATDNSGDWIPKLFAEDKYAK